jgi:hypothetical protein
MSYRIDQSKKSFTAFDQGTTLLAVGGTEQQFQASCEIRTQDRAPAIKEICSR